MSTTGRHHADGERRYRSRPLLGLAAAGALLPLVGAPNANAASVIPEGPLTVRTISPVKGNYINETLQGVVCQAPKTCTEIPYLSFITPFGVARLDNVIKTEADTPIVIYAYSNGAQIAQHWMTDHADDAGVPPAENVTFILMGNSTRKYGGADNEFNVSQPSQYHVIDIAREYDPVADIPDNGFNLLAVANAFSGFFTLHDYRDIDINDPNNIVWGEGNTTYVLVPTDNLPLLNPLRLVGLNALADQLNGPLKEIVDQGYDRSYIPEDARPAPTPTVTAKTVVAEPAPALEPAPLAVTTKAAVAETKAVESTPEPEVDVADTKPAKSVKGSVSKDDDVADAVRSITTTATRELKKLTKPLKSLRPSRPSTDESSSPSKPSSRDSGSSDRSSAGGDSGE